MILPLLSCREKKIKEAVSEERLPSPPPHDVRQYNKNSPSNTISLYCPPLFQTRTVVQACH